MDPNTYNDAELMADLGYKKTKDGCWTTATLTVQKTGDKSTMSKFYDKVVRLFGPSKVKKTGF